MKLRPFILILTALLLLTACKTRPRYVISQDRMAEVLADMHTAEAVVEMNHNQYTRDSVKMALKQSVLERHGVTMEQFDTSLVWYGKNIDKYLELYDRTIEVLEKRNLEAGNVIAKGQLAMVGDSVELWQGSAALKIDDRLPSRMVYFDLKADSTELSGAEIYSWRFKLAEQGYNTVTEWAMMVNYSDSTTAYSSFTTSNDSWNQMSIMPDSTKTVTRLRGYFRPKSEEREVIWIDSISLVRRLLNPEAPTPMATRPKIYKELYIKEATPEPEKNDSIN